MKKTNNKNLLNSLKMEKLSLNPIKRAQQKKRNQLRRDMIKAMGITAGGTLMIGTGAGFGIGFITGKKVKKIHENALEDIGDFEGELEDDEEIEEEDDEAGHPLKIEGTPPIEQLREIARNTPKEVASIMIREDLDPRYEVVSPSGKVQKGFCLNGHESPDIVFRLMEYFDMETVDVLQLIYDFSKPTIEIETIKAAVSRFMADNYGSVVLVDDAKVGCGIHLDKTRDLRAMLSINKEEEESLSEEAEAELAEEAKEFETEDDPYEGMNSITDQEALQDVKYPEVQPVDEADEEEDSSDDETAEEPVTESAEEETEAEEDPNYVLNGLIIRLPEGGNLYDTEDWSRLSCAVAVTSTKVMFRQYEELDPYGQVEGQTFVEELIEKTNFPLINMYALFKGAWRNDPPYVIRRDPQLSNINIMKAPENLHEDDLMPWIRDQAAKAYFVYTKRYTNTEPVEPWNLHGDTIVKGNITMLDLAYSILRQIFVHSIKLYNKQHRDENDERSAFMLALVNIVTRISRECEAYRTRNMKQAQKAAEAAQAVDLVTNESSELLKDDFGKDPTDEPAPEDATTTHDLEPDPNE
mgnify:CR=1 FL=1